MVQEFQTKLKKNTMNLTQCRPVKELPAGEVREAIEYCYQSNEILEVALAVLMNGVVSSKKEEFLLSRSLLKKYFEMDPNVGDRDFSGDQMKNIVGQITQVGFVVRITESSRSQDNRRAAKYKVVHPAVLKLVKASS